MPVNFVFFQGHDIAVSPDGAQLYLAVDPAGDPATDDRELWVIDVSGATTLAAGAEQTGAIPNSAGGTVQLTTVEDGRLVALVADSGWVHVWAAGVPDATTVAGSTDLGVTIPDMAVAGAKQPAVLIVDLPKTENEHFQLKKYGLYALQYAHNYGILFKNFRVPAENLLEPVRGDGLTIAYHGLNLGRVALCANAAGTMRMMLASMLPWAWHRKTYGEPIAKRELVLRRMGRMAGLIVASRTRLSRFSSELRRLPLLLLVLRCWRERDDRVVRRLDMTLLL